MSFWCVAGVAGHGDLASGSDSGLQAGHGRQAKQAAILKSEGESQAIATVFKAIHDGNPDPKLLSYQYLQMLPQLAQGDANKVFVIPSEFAEAFGPVVQELAGT